MQSKADEIWFDNISTGSVALRMRDYAKSLESRLAIAEESGKLAFYAMELWKSYFASGIGASVGECLDAHAKALASRQS